MSFQPLPNPPTSVVVPEMVPRGTTKAIFNPAADNFAQSLNPFSLYLQDFRAWVQNANQVMYDNFSTSEQTLLDIKAQTEDVRQQAVSETNAIKNATQQISDGVPEVVEAAVQDATQVSYNNAVEAAASATTATNQADIATTKAGEASASAALTKGYAEDAAASVAGLPEGTINDRLIAPDKTWSSINISNKIGEIDSKSVAMAIVFGN